MKHLLILFFSIWIFNCNLFAQSSIELASEQSVVEVDSLYYEIPDYPDSYSAYTVAARMIDGLGFRYYWATDGLNDTDLEFSPAQGSRTAGETLDHIFGLSNVVRNSIFGVPNLSSSSNEEITWPEKRNRTLANFKEASVRLKSFEHHDMNEMNMIFQRGDTQNSFPFWNVLNGPLADAIWHVGQVVSYRRLSGNPFDAKVNVLTGKKRE
jgi:hypothetical protein